MSANSVGTASAERPQIHQVGEDLASPKSPLAKWISYLQEPVDGASLAVFRMCFAAVILVFIWTFQDRIYDLYIRPPIHFGFVPGLRVWQGNGMYLHYAAMSFFAGAVGLGFLYRANALLLCGAWTYVFLLEKAYYQNHHYLICLLGVLFFLTPANRVWSLDSLSEPTSPNIPRWSLLIFKVQFAIVYFFGGIAKLNGDWLQGYPQTEWLLARSGDPIFGHIVAQPWFIFFITYGGIALDLSLPFLLMWRRTFWVGAVASLCFHLINARLFAIDVFPLLMFASIGLFAPPDWPRRLLKFVPVGNKPKLTQTVALQSNDDEQAKTKISSLRSAATIATLIFLHLYVVLQIALPLRRFFYPGDTCWTEQGSRFSWMMMLHQKDIAFYEMVATDPQTGKQHVVGLDRVLAPNQRNMMLWHPDMVLHLAHIFADGHQKHSGVRPIVKVKLIESMNGHPLQNLIDPNVDLASQPESYAPYSFIVPLEPLNGRKRLDAQSYVQAVKKLRIQLPARHHSRPSLPPETNR